MKKLTIICAALASLFAMGCKKAPVVNSPIDGLAGEWTTAALEIDGTEIAVIPSEIILEKKSADTLSVNGNSGVNTFFGEFIFKDGKASVSDNMGSTKMAASPEEMDFEDKFLACLTGADNVAIDTDNEAMLVISNSTNNSSLKFVRK